MLNKKLSYYIWAKLVLPKEHHKAKGPPLSVWTPSAPPLFFFIIKGALASEGALKEKKQEGLLNGGAASQNRPVQSSSACEAGRR